MSKRLVLDKYTFNAGAKTVAFTLTEEMNEGQLLHIYNATTKQDLYLYGDSTFTGTMTGNVLTLAISTAGMTNGDTLLIIYEDNVPLATEKQLTDLTEQMINVLGALDDAVTILQRITQSASIPDGNGCTRINFDTLATLYRVTTVTTVTTVATVATVSNITSLGALSATGYVMDMNNVAWQNVCGSGFKYS